MSKTLSKKDRVLEACKENPNATNAEVAAILGGDFTAASVASAKSQEAQRVKKLKERENQKPLDLDVLADAVPKIKELGGPAKIIETITAIRTGQKGLVDAFGTLERAEAIATAAVKLAAIQSV